jgi:transposase-like protein
LRVGRYERSEGRRVLRAGSYLRVLETKAGRVNLKVPKLWRQTFEMRGRSWRTVG